MGPKVSKKLLDVSASIWCPNRQEGKYDCGPADLAFENSWMADFIYKKLCPPEDFKYRGSCEVSTVKKKLSVGQLQKSKISKDTHKQTVYIETRSDRK